MSRRPWSLASCSDGTRLTLGIESPEGLDRIERAHRAIRSPFVARVLRREPDAIVFDCRVGGDLDEPWRTGRLDPLGAGEALALGRVLLAALEDAHRAPGGPWCVGELSWRCLAVDADGRLLVFGFGGSLLDDTGLGCVAPEVALGLPATPASDVYVAFDFLRRLLLRVRPPRGDLRPLGPELLALAQDASAADPARRIPDIAALRSRLLDVGARLTDPPEADFGALRRRLALEVAVGPRCRVDAAVRQVHLPDGSTLDLQRSGVLWRVFQTLAGAHRDRPGAPVDHDTLLAGAWPGERVLPEAARARIYVAISTLRRLGLAPWLVQRDGGYLLAPDLSVE